MLEGEIGGAGGVFAGSDASVGAVEGDVVLADGIAAGTGDADDGGVGGASFAVHAVEARAEAETGRITSPSEFTEETEVADEHIGPEAIDVDGIIGEEAFAGNVAGGPGGIGAESGGDRGGPFFLPGKAGCVSDGVALEISIDGTRRWRGWRWAATATGRRTAGRWCRRCGRGYHRSGGPGAGGEGGVGFGVASPESQGVVVVVPGVVEGGGVEIGIDGVEGQGDVAIEGLMVVVEGELNRLVIGEIGTQGGAFAPAFVIGIDSATVA